MITALYYSDAFTAALRWTVVALTSAVCLVSVLYLTWTLTGLWWDRRRSRRPYDWARDGECDNRSHVRPLP
jgi:hypothetical protein